MSPSKLNDNEPNDRSIKKIVNIVVVVVIAELTTGVLE